MTPHLDPDTAPRSRWVLVPPPPAFVLAFIGGLQLDRFIPLRLVPRSLYAIARPLGVVAIVAAALLLLSAPVLFAMRRTTIVPHHPSRSLVTDGPYRFTRNPMYVGLAILYVGAALVVHAMWPIVLLTLPLWLLHAKTIPFEERNLERTFGDEYRAYEQRVRRWL